MKGMTAGLSLLIVLIANQPVAAQQDPLGKPDSVSVAIEEAIQRSGIVAALDSIAAATAPELERSLEQLAGTLESIGSRIASDPQLRMSAIRAAQGLTNVAQLVLVEQSRVLQEALRTAAERLGDLSVQQDTTLPPR
jgi:hypothetical protein